MAGMGYCFKVICAECGTIATAKALPMDGESRRVNDLVEAALQVSEAHEGLNFKHDVRVELQRLSGKPLAEEEK